MKNLFCMLGIYMLGSVIFSQGVLEGLFYKLPQEYCMGYNLKTRKEAVDQMKEGFKNGPTIF